MAEIKGLRMRVDDAVTYVGALAGVYVNNPEQNFLVRAALTEAQQEICAFRRWTWLRSTGSFLYSANQTSVDMASVSAGKYSAFGGFLFARVGRLYRLYEKDAAYINTLEIALSTSDRPQFYWRTGDTRIHWWPIPTLADSVHFGWQKRPGLVYGGGDLVVPAIYTFNVLFRLARRKVWEARGDPRAQQADTTYEQGLAAMIRDDAGQGDDTADMRGWTPQTRAGESPNPTLSGFYSTGNMPA